MIQRKKLFQYAVNEGFFLHCTMKETAKIFEKLRSLTVKCFLSFAFAKKKNLYNKEQFAHIFKSSFSIFFIHRVHSAKSPLLFFPLLQALLK